MSFVEELAGTERRQLLKILGVTFGVAVAVGDMIGSGILRAPSTLAATVPSVGLIMGLWVLGALNAALNGNVLAELGTAIPKSGGVYNYAQHAFGDVGGLIIGWANWLAFVAGTGAAAISFANFLPLLWPWAAQHTIGVAVAMLLALFGANILGLREGRALQEGTSLIKASMLAVFCVAAVLYAPTSHPLPPAMAAAPMLGWGAAIAAYQIVRGAYAGWDTPFYFGEEVIDAGRVLPRAMYIGMALTAALYIGVNAALLYALGLHGVGSSPLPFTIVLGQFGPVASVLFALTAMITVASCANANIMGGPRIIFAMAREGLLPHWFTSVNRGGTPTIALMLTALLSVALAVSGEFERVFALIGTLNGIGAIAMAVALFVLRRREPGMARPYRAILYPFLPALTLIIEVVFLVLYSWTDKVGILFAIGLSIACIPFAIIARRARRRAES
jgi:APA family basic amino acid/polyamine antiporter